MDQKELVEAALQMLRQAVLARQVAAVSSTLAASPACCDHLPCFV